MPPAVGLHAAGNPRSDRSRIGSGDRTALKVIEITEQSGGDPDRLLALLREREHYTIGPVLTSRGKHHRIRVTAVMRPEIDAKRLAQVLIEVTKDEIARERAAAALDQADETGDSDQAKAA